MSRPRAAAFVAVVLVLVATVSPSSAAEPNQAPIAVDDPSDECGVPALGGMFPIPEDPKEPMVLALNCAPLLNDFDPDGDIITPELVADAPNGGATIWGDSAEPFNFATYMPDPDFSTRPGDEPGGIWDSDRFTYRVTDGAAWSEPATYRVWIAPINDPPTFTPGPDVVEAGQDTPYSGQWATNLDPGPNEAYQTVSFEVTEVDVTGVPDLFEVEPAIDTDGVLTFTPGFRQVGLAHVTVRAVDDGGLEDWNVGQSMLAELPDDTSDEVTFEIVVLPNNPPEIGTDYDLPIPQGAGPTSLDLLANDSDPDGDALHIASVTEPQYGSAVIVDDGASVTYDPDDDHVGLDWFEYTIEDSRGGTATDFVTLAVGGSVNRAPIAVDDPQGACNDFSWDVSAAPAFLVPEDPVDPLIGVVGCDPLNNDWDPDDDSLTYELYSQPAHGAAVRFDELYTSYMPDDDWNSDNPAGPSFAPVRDSFAYRAFDGSLYSEPATVSYRVIGINDAPTFSSGPATIGVGKDSGSYSAQWATDISAGPNEPYQTASFEVDPLTASEAGLFAVAPSIDENGVITFSPAAGKAGQATFAITLTDDGGLADGGHPELLRELPDDTSDPDEITIMISPNAPPVALADSLVVPQNAGPTGADLRANDSDPDGDDLTITSVSQGAHGAVAITGGGSGVTYDPAGLYTGPDSFTYTVSDGRGGTDTATVTVTIAPDTTLPIVGSLARSLPAQAIGTSTVKVALSWKGTDTGTGVSSYRLERRIGSGAWTKVTLASASATSITTTLTLDTAYAFRVRATDRAGNVGSWSQFPTLNAKRIQDTSSLVYFTGTWTKVTSSSLSGGSARHATSSTRRAKVSFTGQEVALIATRRTTGGRAKMLIDGVQVATIDLDAGATQYRRLVFRKGFAGSGAHSIEIRPLGDGRVEIDAFIVLR